MAMGQERAGGLMPSRGGGAPPAAPPPGAPAAPPGGAPDPMAAQGQQQELTPEEQETYLRLAANASDLFYRPKVSDAVVKVLKGGDEVVEPLAQLLAQVVGKATFDGLDAGVPLEPDMVVAVVASLAHDAAQTIPQAIGTQPLDQETSQALFLRAIELLEEQRAGHERGMENTYMRVQGLPDNGAPPEGGGGPPGGGGRPPGGTGLMPSRAQR